MLTPSYSLTATERVLPRLALDFTTASLDSRVTVARALNTATRVNSSGLIETINANLPRFDFTLNTGGACRGLLIEETRTNICLQSQDLNTTWVKSSSSVNTDVAISPDGTQNADQLICAGGTFQMLYQDIPVTSGQSYTLSFYAKSGNASNTQFRVWLEQVGGTATVITPTQSWARYSITATSPDTNVRTAFGVTSGATAVNVYIWGVQVELGAFATSYIPTTTTSAARNADVVTMTGTNFSDWWQATTGSAVARARQISVTGTRPWVQFDDTTANNIIALRGNTTNPELYIKATTDQAQIDAGTIAANTDYGLAGSWNTNDSAAAINGAGVITDTSVTVPTVTQARLGSDGTNYLNGWLQSVRYWPQRIINAEVQAFSKL